MFEHLAPVALVVVMLAAIVAPLVSRRPGVQITGAATVIAVCAVLAPLTLAAGHRLAGLAFAAAALVVGYVTWSVARQIGGVR